MAYNTSEDSVLDEFIRMSQLRYYNQLSNQNSNTIIESETNDSDEEFEISASDLSNEEICDDFISTIKTWISTWNKRSISPYLLGRITVRTYASFDRIRSKTAGQLLHRQIICFLNAVLVEEIMEPHGAKNLTLSTPTNGDSKYTSNLTKSKSHPLFDFISCCSLINAYIKSETAVTNLFEDLNRIKFKSEGSKKYSRTIQVTKEDALNLIMAFNEGSISKIEALKTGDNTIQKLKSKNYTLTIGC